MVDPAMNATIAPVVRQRFGSTAWPLVVMLGSIVLLVVLFAVLLAPDGRRSVGGGRADERQPLIVACAASNRGIMEDVRGEYEREYGVPVVVRYGPSQALLAALEVSGDGDLFLPADDGFLAVAAGRGLVADTMPLATMRGVIAVPAGNPRNIRSVADLCAEGLRVSLADPEVAAIGAVVRTALAADGRWERLAARAGGSGRGVFRTTVHEVANDVRLGSVDAGIVFDAVLHDYPMLEAVPAAELAEATAQVVVGVLAGSRQPARARHFARYLSARDRGLARYRAHGFTTTEGDAWADEPRLVLYAGSMLRPAIEETISAFEAREGCRVDRVYNGCGILVAQMKAGEVPDAYFACDSEFMRQVRDVFPAPTTISGNQLGIIVPAGNPRGIAALGDLARGGLRIGIGHRQQCALGWLTQRTLDAAGLSEKILPDVVLETPTGDMLVNQMRSGSLDAAIVYRSNAAAASAAVEFLPLDDLTAARATQPFAIAATTRYPRLAARLRDAIRSAESRDAFQRGGFEWLDDPVTPAGAEPADPEASP
jgi:molybdate transport system substrate-binding protein